MGVAIGISVVIPCNHGHDELLKIVHAICSQLLKPVEIVIVDSSNSAVYCPIALVDLCATTGIRLVYERRALAFPGDARNIGLGLAGAELIAFVDVQTIPHPEWLEASLDLLISQGVAGVYGATSFKANTTFERLVRDGFYGALPRKTLPGCLFKREVFGRVGQFIDWVRAGEDTEWMLRLELLRVPVVCPPNTLIDYVGLIGLDARKLLKKWYRNYTSSRVLPHFFPQKLLLWLVLYPLLILIAFNWNYLIADWRMDSPLYIGHVTKIVAILPIVVYVLVRGLILPLNRGVSIWRLIPIRFLTVAIVCFIADAIKVLVFSLPNLNCDDSTSISTS